MAGPDTFCGPRSAAAAGAGGQAPADIAAVIAAVVTIARKPPGLRTERPVTRGPADGK
jgi:hypothetical protein